MGTGARIPGHRFPRRFSGKLHFLLIYFWIYQHLPPKQVILIFEKDKTKKQMTLSVKCNIM